MEIEHLILAQVSRGAGTVCHLLPHSSSFSALVILHSASKVVLMYLSLVCCSNLV